MTKELFISSFPHETKVAVLEDDELVEVYFQRDSDAGLAGGIYKGRVSRVLPGMQSAFVDIGLERDAFLYVSDFFEDSGEYDKVFTEAEARVSRYAEEAASAAIAPAPRAHSGVSAGEAAIGRGVTAEAVGGAPPQGAPGPAAPAEAHPVVTPPVTPPTAPPEEGAFHRRHEHRGRRRRRRGRGFGERFGSKREFPERPGQEEPHGFEVLPGESLAKYSHPTPELPTERLAEPSAGPEAPAEPLEHTVMESLPMEGEIRAAPVVDAEEHSLEAAPETSHSLTSREPPVAGPPEEVSETFGSDLRFQPDSPSGGVEEGASPVGEPAKSAVAPWGMAEHTAVAPPSAMSTEPAEPIQHAKGPSVASAGAGVRPGEAGGLSLPQEAEPSALHEEDEAERISERAESASSPAEGPASNSPAFSEEPGVAGGAAQVPTERTETTERAYTLSEPHQRPRFAPRRGRRGRGRFGHRAARPEGGGRPESSRPGNQQPAQIGDLLKEGQEILVQIAKEPLGTKGARITSHIALPGRYLVYMPTINHIGVSRKIASEEERLRLRNVILENKDSLTGGFIVRTAAAGRSEEELKADLKFLATLWSEIRAKAEHTKAPALVHRDLTLVERILRDILSPEFKCVRLDSEIEYEHVLDFVNRFQPSLIGQVKLYTRETPLFEEFEIQAQIDKALKPKVWLKSGGYIVINQTEALVAIDVNTGKYVGKTGRLEDTIVKTNIDAVKEIVRQIRLRDLGGIIVIDFIDMDDRRNRVKVVQALEEALRADRAPTKILSFNEFGLVALTRKRVKQSLERTLSEPCAYCSGSGWVKSVATVCYEILAEARKMARQIEGSALTLRVNPEVARALKSRDGVLISELGSMTQKDVVIKSDPTVHQERFEIF